MHFSLLQVAGVEPARDCSRGILSPLRLPIPPHLRTLCLSHFRVKWAEVDSNHRSNLQQIYSLSPLATRESAHSSVLTDCIFIPHYTLKCKCFLIRVRLRTRCAEHGLRSSLPLARSAHPHGVYFPDIVWKVKKTALAVFLEKVFLMGYLIKLQNVLGRLRDYNSSSYLFRKYQGFTNLTNSFCGFCAHSTKEASI